MKDDRLYLLHMLDAIEEIEGYISLNNKDALTRRAVERCIEIIGEAANKTSRKFQLEHDGVAWKDIIGTRNKLIHDYLGIDENVVWYIVEKSLPELKCQLIKIIKDGETG